MSWKNELGVECQCLRSLPNLMTVLAFQQVGLCRVVITTRVQAADCVRFEGCDKVSSALFFISFIFASWVRS